MSTSTSIKLETLSAVLRYVLGALFVCYCVVYLCACPSAQLALAVVAEFVGLVISVLIFRSNIFSIPPIILQKIPESIKCAWQKIQDAMNYCKIGFFSVVLLLGLMDFSALGLSIAGEYAHSAKLYMLLPATYWVGMHPAISLEVLAGALVENKDFARAEPLYKEVLSIRLKLCGPESDLASAIYADLGDFYVRKNDLASAEKFYRKAILIGPRTGRGYTALATVLRERGEFAASKSFYLKALAVRAKVYGIASSQYADTNRAYLRLLQVTNEGKDLHTPN